MAQTSIGFNGSISAVQWAQSAALLLSSGRAVGTPTDCAVTQVAGQRAVSVSAGQIGGDGVVTTLSSAETIALPAPTNGQWFLLVLNRVWSSGATSLTLRNAATTATAASGPTPAFPATLATSPGVNSDIPVAWLWANSGSTSVQIIPLLLAPASLYPRRGSATARTTLYGTPSSAAGHWALQGREWYNTDTSCIEGYFGPYDATLNPTGVPTPGWFPVAGALPEGYIGRGTQSAVPANNTFVSPDTSFTWNTATRVTTGGMTLDAKGQAYTVPYDGEYEVESQIIWRANATGSRTSWWVRNPADPNAANVTDISNNTIAYSQVSPVNGDLTSVLTRKRVTLAKGDRVVLWVRQTAGGDLAIDTAATAQNRSGCYTAVRYVGPLAGRAGLTV